MGENIAQLNKWRLILGKNAENQMGFSPDGAGLNYMDMEEVRL